MQPADALDEDAVPVDGDVAGEHPLEGARPQQLAVAVEFRPGRTRRPDSGKRVEGDEQVAVGIERYGRPVEGACFDEGVGQVGELPAPQVMAGAVEAFDAAGADADDVENAAFVEGDAGGQETAGKAPGVEEAVDSPFGRLAGD